MSGKLNSKPLKNTFISQARSQQIIDIAIETIAARGFSNTSLDDIANNAGITKGVISYHFQSKQNLIEQMSKYLIQDLNAYVKKEVLKQDTAIDKLHAYIKANFDFVQQHRNKFLVILDLGINTITREDSNPYSGSTYGICRNHIEAILEMGQLNGELNVKDKKTLASAVQGAIDGICLQWAFSEGSISLEENQKILMEMIERYISVKV